MKVTYVKGIYVSERVSVTRTFKDEKPYRRFARKYHLHTGERMNPLNEEECVWKFQLNHSAN